jgi:hypothetical protein
VDGPVDDDLDDLDDDLDGTDGSGEETAAERGGRRARRAAGRRRPLGGVVAVAAAVVLLGAAGLITAFGSAPVAEPSATTASAPTATPVRTAPTPTPAPTPAPTPTPTPPPTEPAGGPADSPLRTAVDPQSAQAVAFLDALRAARVPTSRSGRPEIEAAAVICQQLERGAAEQALVRALPAVLTTGDHGAGPDRHRGRPPALLLTPGQGGQRIPVGGTTPSRSIASTTPVTHGVRG